MSGHLKPFASLADNEMTRAPWTVERDVAHDDFYVNS